MTWRLLFTPQGYGCLEANASLKPVPPGETRESLGYCRQCQAKACLFPQGRPYRRELPRGKRHGNYRSAAELRAEGLTVAGKALIPSCWNCANLRRNGRGFLCRFRPADPPYGRATMMYNRRVADTGCEVFELRREMDIPALEGNDAQHQG